MSPFVSSMLYATRRFATVETSAVGEFEPSFVRKIGSVPPVSSKRSWTFRGMMVQPSVGK